MSSLMTRGYIHRLLDEDQSLRDLLLWCARDTMVCVPLRDDPPGPAPRRLEPSAYYMAEPEKAQAEVDRLAAMTPQQIAVFGQEAIDAERARRAERAAKREREVAKLRETLTALREWNAPKRWREFADRLQIEIAKALRDAERESMFTPPAIPTSPEAWHFDALLTAQRHLARAIESRVDEIERTNDRNAWLDELWAALPSDADSEPTP